MKYLALYAIVILLVAGVIVLALKSGSSNEKDEEDGPGR